VNRFWMNESDLEPEHPAPGLGVDQLNTLLGESLDRDAHVVHLVGDVVHAGAALGEEPADRRVVRERREQLDTAVSDADRGGFDALVVDAGPVLEPAAEQALVGTHRLVEVHDGEAYVVDPACLHQAMLAATAARDAAEVDIRSS